MCHGGSGLACSGPVAERHRKRIRVAPSIARPGLRSSVPPCGIELRNGVDTSVEVRGRPVSAKNGLKPNSSNALANSESSLSGGAAKRMRQSENLVHHPMNLRICSGKPRDIGAQPHRMTSPDAIPSERSKPKRDRFDEGCSSSQPETGGNDSASTAERSLRIQHGDGCTAPTPPQQKCARTDRVLHAAIDCPKPDSK